MTHTLLLQMGVLHCLWFDAFIMNCLPYSSLNGKVPICTLCLDRELFSLPPQAYGCLAFIHDNIPNTSNLASHSLKGVFFLGTHTLRKGHYVYLPNLRKYIITIDVSFYKSTPYFLPNLASPSTLLASTSSTPTPLKLVPLISLKHKLYSCIIHHV